MYLCECANTFVAKEFMYGAHTDTGDVPRGCTNVPEEHGQHVQVPFHLTGSLNSWPVKDIFTSTFNSSTEHGSCSRLDFLD